MLFSRYFVGFILYKKHILTYINVNLTLKKRLDIQNQNSV
jgi:hypothetical protein